MEAYQIKNLNFNYPKCKTACLKNISMNIKAGSFVLLFGRSGSGKTTLLRHLKPQLQPVGQRSGELRFNGQLIEQLDLRQSSSAIGYVMQDPESQIVTDKVWHELAFGLESLGYDQATIRLRVAEVANFFNINDWFHGKTTTLSGGQKQLLNLAAIMTMQPQVLILDEPTSQLDPIAAVEFLETLKKINDELGVTVILSEHRLEEVFSFADKLLLIDDGAIIYDGVPHQIGNFFKQSKHDLAVAMPTPIRVSAAFGETASYPLTLKKGRQWLSDRLAAYDLQSQPLTAAQIEQGTKPSWRALLFKKKASSETTALELKENWFRYDRQGDDVIRDLTLTVKLAEWHAVLGGNGAGKTTLLKLIAGLQRSYRGKLQLFGKPIDDYRADQLFGKTVALLPQNPQTLFAGKTLYLDLAAVFEGRRDVADERAEIERVLQLTELSHLKEQHPYDLSGGEQQRAALAKILLLAPKIILLDEPTKGLDGFFKLKLARILNRLIEADTTILMASHDVEFCAANATRCSLLFDGAIVSSKATVDFFRGNAFYTTAANRMSRHLFDDCILADDIIAAVRRLEQSHDK